MNNLIQTKKLVNQIKSCFKDNKYPILIDEEGVVRHAVLNDLPLGRNIDEMLRMVDALKHHQEHGEVCPAGWQEGEDAMAESPEGVSSYLSSHSESL